LLIILGQQKIFTQELHWEPSNKMIDSEIEECLLELGYERVRYYYDDILQKEREWDLFPWTRLGIKDYILVRVVRLPNNKHEYNNVIIYSKSKNKVIATSPPLYDMAIFKMTLIKKGKSNRIQIKARFIDDGGGIEDYLSDEEFEKYLDKISEYLYIDFE